VLVEVTKLSVVHASVHIVYTRTFSSLLWINTTGELYRLPYKTASSNGDCLEDTVYRFRERVIGFQDGAPIYIFSTGRCVPVFLSFRTCTCLAVATRPLEFTSHHFQLLELWLLWQMSRIVENCVPYCQSFVVHSSVDGYQFNLDSTYYVIKLRRNEM
jgi:hypothetical protein